MICQSQAAVQALAMSVATLIVHNVCILHGNTVVQHVGHNQSQIDYYANYQTTTSKEFVTRRRQKHQIH